MSEFSSLIHKPYKTENGYDIYRANFTSLTQLQSYLLSKPSINRAVFWRLASKRWGTSFAGERYKKALQYLTTPYEEGIEDFLSLEKGLSKAIIQPSEQFSMVNSVAGAVVDINRYLANCPDCMLDYQQVEEKKFVTIHFVLSYPYSTTATENRNRGIATLNLIRILENNGYSVDLKAFELAKCNSELSYITVMLKKYGQLIDIPSCYFPMCSVEFLRRILFRVLETMPLKDSEWHEHYGESCSTKEVKKILKLSDKDIVIGYPREMGIRGNDLMKDTQQMFETIELDNYVKVKKLK